MTLDQNDPLVQNLVKAVVFCMDYGMSQIDDDEKYSEMVDLQNELKGVLNDPD